MAANRPPKIAPVALLSVSKTTLADLVWQLASDAYAPADRIAVLRTIASQHGANARDHEAIARAESKPV